MTSVYLLWSEDWDYRAVLSVHATLDGAKGALLDDAWPAAGPRGGKRPARPDVVEWVADPHADGVTYLRGDGDRSIERSELGP